MMRKESYCSSLRRGFAVCNASPILGNRPHIRGAIFDVMGHSRRNCRSRSVTAHNEEGEFDGLDGAIYKNNDSHVKVRD